MCRKMDASILRYDVHGFDEHVIHYLNTRIYGVKSILVVHMLLTSFVCGAAVHGTLTTENKNFKKNTPAIVPRLALICCLVP